MRYITLPIVIIFAMLQALLYMVSPRHRREKDEMWNNENGDS